MKEDFDEASIDSAIWDVVGSTVEQKAGRLEITPPSNVADSGPKLVSKQEFDLTGCSIDVEVVETLPITTDGPTTFKAVAGGYQTWLRIGVVQDEISFSRKIDGVNDFVHQLAYEPTEHRRWRIREESGDVSFDTSPDGVQWTPRYVVPTPGFASAVKIQLEAGTNPVVADPGTAKYDNLNLAP